MSPFEPRSGDVKRSYNSSETPKRRCFAPRIVTERGSKMPEPDEAFLLRLSGILKFETPYLARYTRSGCDINIKGIARGMTLFVWALLLVVAFMNMSPFERI